MPKAIERYTEKAVFYIRWVRHGHNLPPCQIPDPSGSSTTVLTLENLHDFREAGTVCPWLNSFCARHMRAVDYAGCAPPKHTKPNDSRLQYVFQMLGIDAASVGHLRGPGERDFCSLARYRIAEKMRRMGHYLRSEPVGLVSKDDQHNLTWAPSTDVFDNPAWILTRGGLPNAKGPGSYPAAAAPGYLLPFV